MLTPPLPHFYIAASLQKQFIFLWLISIIYKDIPPNTVGGDGFFKEF